MDLVLVLLGLLMGGALGALAGGGSILAVPMLVYIAGETVKVGTTASLVAVGAAALAGAIGHFFAGRVKVGKGLLFGVVGVGGSLLGSALNRVADPNLLLLLFALSGPAEPCQPRARAPDSGAGAPAVLASRGGGRRQGSNQDDPGARHWRHRSCPIAGPSDRWRRLISASCELRRQHPCRWPR